MERDIIIESIISIPKKFYENRKMSAVDLLENSGYFEIHKEISESDIEDALMLQSHYINDWLIWSEDQRDRFGWFFMLNEVGSPVVGEYSIDGYSQIISFENIEKACSVFIKKEIELIRIMHKVSKAHISRLLNKRY